MKTGVFGGAFNPVHNGHINLAEKYISILNLDKLLIVPTANPPHRSSECFAAANQRVDMLKLAFRDFPNAEISEIEFHRKGKSYTYDTLLELKKIYPDSEFFLILGQDQFLNFDKWYNYKKISQVAVLCTAAREKDSRKKLLDFASGKLKISNCYIADFEPVVVSSSEIREKIKNNIDISGLVPNAVKDYIINKEIYVEKF